MVFDLLFSPALKNAVHDVTLLTSIFAVFQVRIVNGFSDERNLLILNRKGSAQCFKRAAVTFVAESVRSIHVEWNCVWTRLALVRKGKGRVIVDVAADKPRRGNSVNPGPG